MYETIKELIEFEQDEKSGLLNLSCMELTHNVFSEVAQLINKMTWLTELDLSDNEIFGLDSIDILPNLKKLNIGRNQLSNFNFAAKMPNLEVLNMEWNPIIYRHFEQLQTLTHLKELNLQGTNTRNLSFLQPLKSLRRLELNGVDGIESLEPLTHLPNLGVLIIKFSTIIDASAIAKLEQLFVLILDHTELEDYQFLANFPNLRTLDLTGCKVENIDFLKNLTTIWHLILTNNRIRNINVLRNLVNMNLLYIGRNPLIKDYSSLASLDILLHLDISHNKLTNIDFLASVKELTTLDLESNYISTIEPLQKLEYLEQLTFYTNETVDLSSLKGLTKLKELKINGSVKNTEAIGELTALRKLELKNGNLVDIDFLQPLLELQHLDVSNNKIKNIDILEHLIEKGALGFINLEYNQITDLLPVLPMIEQRFVMITNESGDVEVRGNPIETELMPYFELGNEYVWAYLKAVKQMNRKPKNFEDFKCLNIRFYNQYRIEHLALFKNVEHLDLTNSQFITNLKVFEKLEKLEILTLKNTKLDFYPGDFGRLKLVHTIDLTNCKLIGNQEDSLSFIIGEFGDMPSLKILKGLKPNKDSIGFLEPLKNQKVLHLEERVANLLLLEGATFLKSLRIDDYELKDITPLSALTALEELVLLSEKITDGNPIGNCTKLKKLEIGLSYIKDISFLENLTELESLEIISYDFSPLQYLTKLQFLFVPIINNELVKYLKNAKDLKKIQSDFDEGVSALVNLPQLEHLELNCESARNCKRYDEDEMDFSGLCALTQLKTLKLETADVGSLDFLKNYYQLEYLEIDSIGIDDVRALIPLVKNGKLKEVKWRKSTIAKWKGIEALKALDVVIKESRY